MHSLWIEAQKIEHTCKYHMIYFSLFLLLIIFSTSMFFFFVLCVFVFSTNE
jgi:hypothetical protein